MSEPRVNILIALPIILIQLALLSISIYIVYLVIKALRIYIKKNQD